MNVNGIIETKNKVEGSSKTTPNQLTPSMGKSRQRHVSALSSSSVAPIGTEPVNVQVDTGRKSTEHTDRRSRANEVIAMVNLLAEATTEIDNFAKSIEGIVDQADRHSASTQRLDILEREANQLVDAIKVKASSTASQSLSPSDVRLEIEEKLGKTLEALFPRAAQDAFGIGNIGLYPPENILNVRASVAEARQRIDQLREMVSKTQTDISVEVAALDVAAQNSEAAQSNVRDVDQAVRLADQTRASIGDNQEAALNSFGVFRQGAINLLG